MGGIINEVKIKTENFPWQKGKKTVLIVSSSEALKGTVTQAVRESGVS